MSEILKKLEGGDRRSIGRANEVVEDVLDNPTLFDAVFEGMLSDDPLIRMRGADAVEKITARRPDYLQPFKKKLLEEVANIDQHEVRWHVAQMLPRLTLSRRELKTAVETLLNYLSDESSIVKTFAMQALADFAGREVSLRDRLIKVLEKCTRAGSPAMKSRGRKLLKRLKDMQLNAEEPH
jgi:HEAT repeat protein